MGILMAIASCKKPEEVNVERVEEIQTYVPKQEDLAGAMKRASIMMKRLARAVEDNDWVKMDMWAHELKEGIGFNCVELYMFENNDIPNEFIMLSDKFNSAINKLILCSKEHDTNNANLEFDRIIKSCDACHESFNKDMEKPLDFIHLEKG
ncbi:MAG: cytochrome c (CII) [Candidatus Scalindua rubra]|uniref:Cytochrome c (CII) n=1 Tax=Candidatus Scalindua rubra TaxID=1872076 RepID=A0A1E3X532_9BACT|nr:MAG: cytochrome c (CII) [Candidatus Scalindua rubra]